MGLIENAKEIADLVKKIGDVELYRKIVELEGEIINLSRRLHQVETENDGLKQSLTTKQSLQFEEPFFISSEKQKCCAHCWQSEQKLVFVVGPRRQVTGAIAYTCPTCFRVYTSSQGQWSVLAGAK